MLLIMPVWTALIDPDLMCSCSDLIICKGEAWLNSRRGLRLSMGFWTLMWG